MSCAAATSLPAHRCAPRSRVPTRGRRPGCSVRPQPPRALLGSSSRRDIAARHRPSAHGAALWDLALTQSDLESVPIPVILGVALVVGIGVNAAIVVGAGAFAASKGDDDFFAEADRTSASADAASASSAPSSTSSDDFDLDLDLDSIFALVESAEADDVERRVSSAPGRDVYAPSSFAEMVADAADAVRAAVVDGQMLLEVQLPAPARSKDQLEVDSDAAQAVNLQLAAAFGADFVSRGNPATGLPWRTHVLVPDRAEYDRARSLVKRGAFDGAFDARDDSSRGGSIAGGVVGRVTVGTLAEVDDSLAGRLETVAGGADLSESVRNAMAADLLVAVNCSSVELLAIEAYRAKFLASDSDTDGSEARDAFFSETDVAARTAARARPLVVFNCDLDDLRGDLGLVGFPPKELHHRFMSRILPVFYVRRREYNKTFLGGGGGGKGESEGQGQGPVRQVYYGGALFREYPGPWQVMRKTPEGLRRVRDARERFRLREVKQALKEAAGVAEEAGSADEFLRGEAGVWEKLKPGTWWEQPDAIARDASDNWRR